MGNTLACFPLSSINGKQKSPYKSKVETAQNKTEENTSCVSFFPLVGKKKWETAHDSLPLDEEKVRRDICDKAPPTNDRSATTVHLRAKNSRRLPRPLKIEENSRYVGQVPILLSEFTICVSDASCNNKRTEDIATNRHKNPKRQRSAFYDASPNIDTSFAVPIAHLASGKEKLEGLQILRQRSFSLDNADTVLHGYENCSNVVKGRWRKYLKYSIAVKNCQYAFEYRRNTLDCPSSLEKDDLKTSVERRMKISQSLASIAEPALASSINYEHDRDNEQLSSESECISDNFEETIVSRKPLSLNDVVRNGRQVNTNAYTSN